MVKKKPDSLGALKFAIRQAAQELPLESVRKAIDGFYKRCYLAVQAQGKHFQHMLKRKDLPQAPPRAGADPQESGQEPLLDVAINRDFGMVNFGAAN